jgi:hypothetical protein
MQMIQTDLYDAMVDVLRDVAHMIIGGDPVSVDAIREKRDRARLVLHALENSSPKKPTDPPSNTGGAGPWSRRRTTVDKT